MTSPSADILSNAFDTATRNIITRRDVAVKSVSAIFSAAGISSGQHCREVVLHAEALKLVAAEPEIEKKIIEQDTAPSSSSSSSPFTTNKTTTKNPETEPTQEPPRSKFAAKSSLPRKIESKNEPIVAPVKRKPQSQESKSQKEFSNPPRSAPSVREKSISSSTTKSVLQTSLSSSMLFKTEIDVLDMQKKGLVKAVKEAQKAEEKRAEVIALIEGVKSKKKQYDTLQERYDKERLRDQQKIQQLVDDFKTLCTLKENGELQQAISIRQRLPLNTGKTDGSDTDRFAGMKTGADVIGWKRMCETFDKYDKKAQMRVQPKFDTYAEKKRLMLLNEKRHILQNLIGTFTDSLKCLDPNYIACQPAPRSFKTISEFGGSSSSYTARSDISCATFVSKNSRY